jgi:SAM-dependent methyltransferase
MPRATRRVAPRSRRDPALPHIAILSGILQPSRLALDSIMKESFVPLLRCPVDGSLLQIDSVADRTPSGDITTGFLRSASGRRYPIVRGVPYVHGEFRSQDEASTVSAFGAEWARYDDFDGYMGSPELFSEFSGLEPSNVENRRVLEVGCGGGRWLRVLAGWGAREVVGLDFSSAVDQAAHLTRALPQVQVVRGSALEMPFAPVFDLVVSIGVLHHLHDPVLGLQGIQRALAGQHRVAFWVYAREGNETYLRLVQPLRRIGPRLPRSVLAGLSRALATALWCHTHSTNRLALAMGIRLPLSAYLGILQRLRFRDLESVVYDQLTPSIARYPSREEVLEWVAHAGGRVERLYHRTQNSWQCHLSFPTQHVAAGAAE